MNSVTETRLHVGSDLHRKSQDLFELDVKSRKVEKTPPLLHLHEDVDVAFRMSLATSNRPVDAYIRSSIPLGGRLYLNSLGTNR